MSDDELHRASPAPFQHPCLLTFNDALLEGRYKEYITRGMRWKRDRTLFAVNVVPVVGFLILVWFQEDKHVHWSMICYAANLVVRGSLMYLLPRAMYLKHRTWITVSSRIVANVCGALVAMEYWVPSLHIKDIRSLVLMVAVMTGIVNLMYEALMEVLDFKIHLCVQSVMTLLHSTLLRSQFCSRLFSLDLHLCDGKAELDDGGAQATCQTDIAIVVRYLQSVWRAICSVSGTVGYGVLPVGFTARVQKLVLSRDHLLCSCTVLAIQLVAGLVMPSVILYLMEWRSRSFFLEKVERHEGYLLLAERNRGWVNRVRCLVNGCLVMFVSVCLVSSVVMLVVVIESWGYEG